jgi:hypothetical protein
VGVGDDQLQDRQLDGAGPGAPPPRPVTVTGIDPFGAALAVAGATDRVDPGAHQRAGERLDHRPQQIRARRPDPLAPHAGRSTLYAVTIFHLTTHPPPGPSYTTPADATLRPLARR